MKFQLKKSETSVILTVFIQNSGETDGSGLSGLDQTSGITGGYLKRNGTGVALAVDEDVTTEGTYQAPSTAGQVRIGTPANMPAGTYELHFHNDLFTTADWVTVILSGATDMAPLTIEVQLTSADLNDAVRLGLTALPNAAADAAGGLPISDAGGLDLDAKLANPILSSLEIRDAMNLTRSEGDTMAGSIDDLIERVPVQLLASSPTGYQVGELGGFIEAILDDTSDMQPKIGTPANLGGGATLAGNASDIAGPDFVSATEGLSAIAADILPTIEAKIDTIDSIVDAIFTDTDFTIPTYLASMNNISSVQVIAACASALNSAEPLNANLTKIGGSTTVDGISMVDLFKSLLAMAAGRIKADTPVAGQTTIYEQDGTTPLLVFTTTTSERDPV